ncbi:MAG: hypothetical protein ACI4WQ_01455 [Sharpea porci]
MNKNFKSKLVAGLMTTAMIFSSAAAFAPVHADSNSVAGGITTFYKYLVINENATVPNVTFDFSIRPAKNNEIKTATPTTQEVVSAENNPNVVGSPTITDPIFTSDDTKDATKEVTGGITLNGQQKFVSKKVTVDFTGVTFKKTGIYRYIVSEAAPNKAYKATLDTKALDVYVTRNDATNPSNDDLIVKVYVLHEGTESEVKKDKADTKESGFENTLNSHNLAFGKITTGNQRNLDDAFNFTLSITKALPSTTFTVLTTSTVDGTKGLTNIKTDDQGAVTQKVSLKNGERFEVIGLNDGAAYSVKEEANTLGYTLKEYTPAKNTDTKTGETAYNVGGTDIQLTDSTVADSNLTGDAGFSFTNEKSGQVPTGIIFAVAPFAVGAVVLAAFIIVKMRRTAKQ